MENKRVFEHAPLPKIELTRHDSLDGRRYLTPEGNKWPSVTTVINFEPKPGLEEWKNRIGEDAANAICKRAAARGTLIHSYAEDYLNNKEPSISMFDVDLWRKFSPILDRVNNIRLLEGKMYSDKLQLAGTVDCIGEFDGELSVIDFKTSSRLKSEDDILGYFLQCTAYACMAYERYDLRITRIAVLIAVDDEEPQIFIKSIKDYIDPLMDVINRYKKHVRSI